MTALNLTSDLREQTLDICQSLVRVQSFSGQEADVVELVSGWMNQLGYEDVRVDECGNVIGKLSSGRPGPVVLFDSHVDTVPAPNADDWTYPPFGGEIIGERIYGRGTTDMKGPLAAALVGCAAAKTDGVLRGTVFVCASVGEEHIEGVALQPVLKHYAPDLVVICEPTALKLAVAQRGRAEIEIVVHGKSAHASNPEVGINAFRHMSRLAVELDKLEPPVDALLGAGILEPTTVISSPYPNVSVIPFRCMARYDRRTLIGEDATVVLAPIQQIIDEMQKQDAQFRAEAYILPGKFMCYTGLELTQETFAPAWQMQHDDSFVRSARNVLEGVELSHYSFCTNGSYSKGRANRPTIGYGPGYEHHAHIVDEYLDFDQLFGAVQGYYALSTMR